MVPGAVIAFASGLDRERQLGGGARRDCALRALGATRRDDRVVDCFATRGSTAIGAGSGHVIGPPSCSSCRQRGTRNCLPYRTTGCRCGRPTVRTRSPPDTPCSRPTRNTAAASSNVRKSGGALDTDSVGSVIGLTGVMPSTTARVTHHGMSTGFGTPNGGDGLGPHTHLQSTKPAGRSTTRLARAGKLRHGPTPSFAGHSGIS